MSEKNKYDLEEAKRLIADALTSSRNNYALAETIKKRREEAHGELLDSLLKLHHSYDGLFIAVADDTRDPRRHESRELSMGISGRSSSVELRFDHVSGEHALHRAAGNGLQAADSKVPITFDLYTNTFRGPVTADGTRRSAVAAIVEEALKLLDPG